MKVRRKPCRHKAADTFTVQRQVQVRGILVLLIVGFDDQIRWSA
jgi:hypothetical protein